MLAIKYWFIGSRRANDRDTFPACQIAFFKQRQGNRMYFGSMPTQDILSSFFEFFPKPFNNFGFIFKHFAAQFLIHHIGKIQWWTKKTIVCQLPYTTSY